MRIPDRISYLIALGGLLTSIFVNVGTLAGLDLINALLVIWPVTGFVHLVFQSRHFPGGMFALNWSRSDYWDRHRRLMRNIPARVRPIVYATWAYSAVGVLLLLLYFATHGQVHGLYYTDGSGIRLATPFEIRREHGWVLFGFTAFAASFLIMPALYYFFDDLNRGLIARRTPPV